ncbi:S8 family serine peptidase [Amycolatopsis sp. NPDC051045]|uniref:S8 family serine peptidase n=1 Tax=Amycolatopsis sp. NPDC051045 TaxID=3156922 RepID=UPI0034391CDD
MKVRDAVGDLPAMPPGSSGSVCIAVLDGPVDLSHPCFAGAHLEVIDTLVQDPASRGAMSVHGTHVTSLIFGQPGSPVVGVLPGCRGLIVPVFRDDGLRLSQLDLARAIEAAVAAGADIITISGGERTPDGEPDALLANALRLCAAHDVLVVAAVGNDGDATVQVPAADPTVLAVGACTAGGVPLATNNWGAPYRLNGVLAPGHDIEGARPDGGTVRLSGSSFATPIVAGVAGLLLAQARSRGEDLVPATLRHLIVSTAAGGDTPRHLAGVLDVPAAFTPLKESETTVEQLEATPPPQDGGVVAACADTPAGQTACEGRPLPSHIYAIGTIGWDFGSEARRDGFIQQMDVTPVGDHLMPGNPYDPAQLFRYLAENPWASDKLIWTCNLDGRMPIYALEAETPFGMTWGGPRTDETDGADFGYPPVSLVHKTFREAIVGQSLGPDNPSYVARVSVPGTLTNRTVRLFSGQVVPVVVVHAQGLYTWNEAVLLDDLIDTINKDYDARNAGRPDEQTVRLLVRAFLDKVYYQFRNLGQSSPDRALNYAATNAFELTRELANGFLSGRLTPRRADEPEVLYALDDITVTKSRYARPDADAWDVKITYFDPENDRRSRVAYLQTFDVSTSPPVSLAPSHQFLVGS